MTSTFSLTTTSSGDTSLRILMVAPQPFFRPRGTPFSVLHRIRALVETGHRVDLVTYPFGEPVEMDGLRIIRAPTVPGITDVRIGPSIAKLLLDLPLYRETRRMLRDSRYDVIHSHEEAAFFCTGLARRHQLLHVYDMHSSLPQQLANFRSFNVAPIRALFSSLERRVLETCDGVITICAELGDIATRHTGATPHMMIENTGDDARVFPPGQEDPLAPLNIGDKPVVLYTGTLESYQGIDLLLGAMKDVISRRDCHLVVVGGNTEQIKHYQAMASDLGINASVSFTGTVHPREIQGFIRGATLIVSPRCSGTNTPLKIYGYMRTGKPLVATDLATHTQTLDHSTAELVDPDSAGIANGILRILSDPGHGEHLAQTAIEVADRLYSDRSYTDKVTGFYHQVINRAQSASPGVTNGIKVS